MPREKPTEHNALITGGGEAAKHLRAIKWQQHPLGPVKQWSPALRTSTNFILNSLQPAFLIWGDENLLIYNDAWQARYNPSKEVWPAQGQAASKIFGSYWKHLEPLVHNIQEGDESLLGLDHLFEFGHDQQSELIQWSLNVCPLYDKNGATAGVLMTINEESRVPTLASVHTERMNHSRELWLLKSLLDADNLFVLTLQTNGKIENCNAAASQLSGYSMQELTGLHFSELLGPGWPERRQLQTALDNARALQQVPFRLLGKNGTLLSVLFTLSPIFDNRNKLFGFSCIVQDISSFRQSEKLLQDTEERLNMVLGAAEMGTWELNYENGEVAYSQKYIEILGYTWPQKLTHSELLNHIYPPDVTVRENAMKKALQEGPLNYEFRIVRTDGEIRWIEVRGHVIYNKQKQPLKLIGTFRDITERRQRVDELRESEQKFRILADSVPQLIWTGDPDGNLNYFNLSFFEYTGLTPRQIHREGWIQIVHPEDRLESVKQWAVAVERGEPFLTEHRFKRYDGHYRWHLSRALPQKDIQGKTQMWVGTSTDVHDQKVFSEELEKNVQLRTTELKKAIDDLTKTNQELEQFAYVASHDLQEPLRKIQTFSGILTAKTGAEDEGRIYLDKINASAARMTELIRDLLNYSRLTRGKEQYVDTDLNLILDKVKSDFEVLIQQKKALIIHARLPVIRAVPVQMNQLFYNLIGNSLKFCDKKPFIEIAAQKATPYEIRHVQGLNPENEYWHFTFRDNGIGFSQEYAEQIFVIFQRLNDMQEYSGTGIGLAVCKKIVENHGGKISAQSEPGKGATFNIYLPC